ncbi:Putative transcriptional regulator yvhJ [Slackia heliotrinireducens]|uniref:Cell envelope-related function transcriptional attenuator common domain protein n=1 Tax=Slackia heliotrinireducens (strain ATCC 29202 / DSM 20476 / NCTC 11029 / RHS 1) TaxID=471855 RepID=C7N1H4_SLAHD|nr:LCP family protein [Slackia heliotrinireducens]ACV21266.1 cell envelope-related function transcriptional attenuator common domain protein [Slackia heliotrinireducens DSM 20476]VEG98701.1 Putative transcriptional regulator yvhJ [Slackia heliotrinireducens]
MGNRRRSGSDSYSAYSRQSNTPYSSSNYGTSAQGAADRYSRRTQQAEYGKQMEKKRRGKRVLTTVLVSLLVVLFAGAAAFGAYYFMINSNLHQEVDEDLAAALDEVETPTDPFYVLLLGVDRSESRDGSAEFGDVFRSDTIILARIDPTEKQATLISIVRDTYVDIEGYGPNKINAAHAFGGPALTVKTVSEFAGVPISHYVEVDFDGFEAAVDAVGGVDVDVPITIDDDDAGGYVAAGEQTLSGEEALILCRARHAYDEYGDGDMYRAANQRMVIGALAEKVLAADTGTMLNLITDMSEYVTTDMSVAEIASVAMAMRGMDTDSIYSCSNPTTSAYENDVWYEYSNNQAWTVMMQRVDAGLSPTGDDATSSNNGGIIDGTVDSDYIAETVLGDDMAQTVVADVVVLNGNGVDGSAARASSILMNNGMTVVSTGSANSYEYGQTVVVYNDPSFRDEAEKAQGALGVGYVFENDGTYAFTGDVLVVVGADF